MRLKKVHQIIDTNLRMSGEEEDDFNYQPIKRYE